MCRTCTARSHTQVRYGRAAGGSQCASVIADFDLYLISLKPKALGSWTLSSCLASRYPLFP